MLFNSPIFLVFLTVVFLVYWRLGTANQNRFLLVASYLFYGWWDWRFLLLLIGSSTLDFFLARLIAGVQGRRRRHYLLASLLVNLGVLGFFKYFNFFIASFADLLLWAGVSSFSLPLLNIVLPVGISFYTFQSLSYTIDVYRQVIKPEPRLLNFLVFVSFFPQLVAGPIERAANLLGQFSAERRFDWQLAADGCRQMLWGFFKKIVVADTLASVVNQIYQSPATMTGGQLWVGTFFFTFQIYCDFSGYSDIAIGCARLFGFRLMRNFAYPYFAKNLIEFWRRWHISLSTWFKDYVFFPLGGSRVHSYLKYVRNILVVFLVSGLWHGANLTFLVWGLWHGIGYLVVGYFNQRRSVPATIARPIVWRWREVLGVLATFGFVVVGWVFFRAASVTEAYLILGKMFGALGQWSQFELLYPRRFALIAILVVAEWFSRQRPHALAELWRWRPISRWAFYYALLLFVLLYGSFNYTPFIYFQF